MQPAPVKEGKILLDPHTHPGNYFKLEKIRRMLASPGIVGLSHINGETRILFYEKAVTLPGVKEIDKGMLAEINFEGKKGYFLRTQEVIAGFAHILALGFEGDYFPNYDDPRKAVEEIHRRNALAILNHPYVTPNLKARIIKYRFINDNDEKRIVFELSQMVDEVEAFNAQNINPLGGLIVPNMKKANEQAEEIVIGGGFKWVAASDAHFRLEQVKICGIYLDLEDLCMEKIREDIKKGNFERYGDAKEGPYVNRRSFFRGMFRI